MWVVELLLAAYCLKIVLYCMLRAHGDRWRERLPPVTRDMHALSVDIILPMYNEEKVVVKTIANLLDITYDKLCIIVVDDGSSDRSYDTAVQHYGSHPRIRIVRQDNHGKSSALNRGMSLSHSDIIVCIDADTLVRPDVMEKLLPHFQDERVAAVSGYVNVGNRINFLTDMQQMEYDTIQNEERTVFETINGILVVPGALGAFRLQAVRAVGGFVSQALAEDCDITLRMLCKDYVIRNERDAIAYTEAPDSPRMFFKQRVRWTVGLAQGLLTHHKRLFGHRNKALAWIVLPYAWLYRIILPALTPFADYIMIWSFFTAWQPVYLPYYLTLIALECMIGTFILVGRKKTVNPLKLLLLQRVYRHLILVSYVSVLNRWMRGNLYGWSKIPRQGNVELD